MARKLDDLIGFTLRIRESLRRRIEMAAHRRNISINAEMERRLEDSFDFPALLRRDLERAAAENGLSMNAEAVRRLIASFHAPDQTDLIVDMLLRNLDDAVIDRLVEKVNLIVAEDMRASMDQDYFEDQERSK